MTMFFYETLYCFFLILSHERVMLVKKVLQSTWSCFFFCFFFMMLLLFGLEGIILYLLNIVENTS